MIILKVLTHFIAKTNCFANQKNSPMAQEILSGVKELILHVVKPG